MTKIIILNSGDTLSLQDEHDANFIAWRLDDHKHYMVIKNRNEAANVYPIGKYRLLYYIWKNL